MRYVKIIAALMLSSCLATAPVSAASLLGGLVTTSGDGVAGVVNGAVSGLLNGSSGDSASSVSVNAGGLASVGADNSGGTHVNASPLGGGGSSLDVGTHSVLGGTSNVGLSLPGTGNSGLDGTLGGVTNTVNGLTGNGGTVDTLLTGVTGNNGALGGLLGTGGTGAGGTGNGGTGGVGGGNGGGGGLIVRNPDGGYTYLRGGNLGVPALASLACTNRNSPQAISQLLKRHRYGSGTLGAWQRAANVQLVPIKLCTQLRRSVAQAAAADSNVATLQSLAAADPLISASLARGRYHAGNVLAVDQTQGLLTVYVY